MPRAKKASQPLTQQHDDRFPMLDGMRGIAAICAVLHQLGGPLGLPFLAPRGYLAADLFFVLSGLVVAHAYSHRLRRGMKIGRFLERRITRLYPMLVLGTVFALTLTSFILRRDLPTRQDLAIAGVMGSLGLPILFASSLPPAIFPINVPIWFVFFELIGNVAFAFIAKLKSAQSICFMIAALSLGGVVAGVALWGRIGFGSRIGDWPWGFPRVGFSFFVGVMLNRYRDECPRIPPAMCLTAVVSIFFVPSGHWFDRFVDLGAVVLLFPLVVAALSLQRPRSRWRSMCDFGAAISYPIYAIHYPVAMALASMMILTSQPWTVRLFTVGSTVAALILLSWWLFNYIDAPFREAITADLRRMRANRATGGT